MHVPYFNHNLLPAGQIEVFAIRALHV